MLCLKKVYNDELLQLTLILSLLRVYSNSYFEFDPFIRTNNYDFSNGTSWLYHPSVTRSTYVNHKSLDVILLNYERQLFADLNSLGRYNRINPTNNLDVTAYLLNIDRQNNIFNSNNSNTTESLSTASTNTTTTNTTSNNHDGNEEEQRSEDEASGLNGLELGEPLSLETDSIELTQEDMDLIEILWKQDVDLGYSLDISPTKSQKQNSNNADTKISNGSSSTPTSSTEDDDVEKLKTLEALNDNFFKTENTSEQNDLNDPWNGLSYIVDTETGEYILKGGLNSNLPISECDSSLPLSDLPLPEYFLEEAFQLDLNDTARDIFKDPIDSPPEDDSKSKDTDDISTIPDLTDSAFGDSDINSKDFNSDEEFNILADMIQTAQFHHPSSRAFQGRMPFVRTMSIEQRWQDLANLLSIPAPGDTSAIPPHHPFSHHHPAFHNYNHPHGPGVTYGHDGPRNVLLHNATLNPPIGEINSTGSYSNIGGTNLGSAVATSMNLTNSTEPMGEPTCGSHFKIDTPHDMLYYSNPSSEINQTTEGFLSSILNDEDLQLMDLAMNEGMYTMRILDNGTNASNLSSMVNGTMGSTASGRIETEKMDTSSDSALSSMGSERVPSLSDGEWCDAGSDSGHTLPDHYIVDYNSSKYRPYEYNYNNRQPINNVDTADRSRLAPVAQKKHHMFGKRYFQEQGASAMAQEPPASIKYEYGHSSIPSFNGQPREAEGVAVNKTSEIKYSCTVEFSRHLNSIRNSVEHVQHNHTYHLPPESTGAMQRPISRDKHKSKKSEEEHLTRDEKRARALSVPISVQDIINLPMDEFNERLSKYDLNEPQLTLIRDIRRRGKNKVAAQNCRKRKLDQILSLADEVRDMRDRKHRLISERDFMISERQRVKEKFAQLYRHIFENLRDPDGNLFSPYQYSLQQSADGSILVVPRANSTLPEQEHKEPHQNCKK